MGLKAADPAEIDDNENIVSETTPLLGAPETSEPSNQSNGSLGSNEINGHATPKPTDPGQEDTAQEREKKFDTLQVLLLCLASFGEPVAFFGIFPFLNEMVALNGDLNEKDVGFYSGLIESLFSLTQVLLMIVYGRAADRLGRKPVLVFSLTGVGFATALFGLSKTIWQMVATRCLAGVFAGSVVTVRTMLSENTDKGTQARAFSWYAVSRNMGISLGPLIGMSASSHLSCCLFAHDRCRTNHLRRHSREPSAAIPVRLRRRATLRKISLRAVHLRDRGHRVVICPCILPLHQRDSRPQNPRPVQQRTAHDDVASPQSPRRAHGRLDRRARRGSSIHVHSFVPCIHVHERGGRRVRLLGSKDRALHGLGRRQPGGLDAHRLSAFAEAIRHGRRSAGVCRWMGRLHGGLPDAQRVSPRRLDSRVLGSCAGVERRWKWRCDGFQFVTALPKSTFSNHLRMF